MPAWMRWVSGWVGGKDSSMDVEGEQGRGGAPVWMRRVSGGAGLQRGYGG